MEVGLHDKMEKTDYKKVLDQLAHIVSHQVRKPIGTMSGIINLMQLDLLTEEEYKQSINTLNACLQELDRCSRELGELIHAEQCKG